MLSTIKNDKEFEVKVNYQDADGKDQEATIAPGAEIEVPEATAEAVKQQVEAAKAPEKEETAEEKTAREAQEAEAANVAAGKNPDGSEKTNVPAPAPAAGTETAANPEAGTSGDLSKAEREELETLRAGKAEAMFSKLVEEGKVVPAQKEAILALAKTSGPEAVATMFAKAAKVIDFSEHGSQTEHKDKGEGQPSGDADLSNVKQWSDLSESEQSTNKALGLTEAVYNATALANPEHYRKDA